MNPDWQHGWIGFVLYVLVVVSMGFFVLLVHRRNVRKRSVRKNRIIVRTKKTHFTGDIHAMSKPFPRSILPNEKD